MPPPKFKLRLGAQQHLLLSGKQYTSRYEDDAFSCRLTLKCNALQATGHSKFTRAQIESFLSSLVHLVRDLKGTCELVPNKCGSVSVRVAVTDTGAIATDVVFPGLSSTAIAHTGWNVAARFHCEWPYYYNPVDIACLDVPSLTLRSGHIPAIESSKDRESETG